MQLHAIEEVEGAKGKLTGGLVKVDYATGEVRVRLMASTGPSGLAPRFVHLHTAYRRSRFPSRRKGGRL